MPGFKVQYNSAGAPQIEGPFGVARASAFAAGGSSLTGVALTFSSKGDGPASGATTAGGVGFYFGSGTPTFAAGTGAWFINDTPNGGVTVSSSRAFISTNGQGGWTGVQTVS